MPRAAPRGGNKTPQPKPRSGELNEPFNI
jgi:hypothetical protein